MQRWIRIVGVLALCSLATCERVGKMLDDARPEQPPTATPRAPTAPAYEDPALVPLPAPVPPWEEDPIPDFAQSLEGWDAAQPAQKEMYARGIAERLPIFEYLRLESFSSGGQTHEVAVFRHERTQLEFVLVPAGTFQMGSPSSEDGRSFDETRRTVHLRRPFLICRTEVTQAAWTLIRSKNPSKFEGDRNPVETITIIDIERFLMRTKLELPTEAQWEYACRAGTTTAYSFGGSDAALGEHAWYDANSGGSTHEVATKKPNAFGLFDVHGNVMEWCGDGYAVPEAGEVTDPEGPATAADKVVKGGSFQNQARVQRSAFRLQTNPADKQPGIGFRPVRAVGSPR